MNPRRVGLLFAYDWDRQAFDHLVRFVERRVVPWKGRG